MPTDKQTGSASVEFIFLALLLLIPTIYLLIAASQIQAAGYAVVAASDQAARIVATPADVDVLSVRADQAIETTLADFGIDAATQSEVTFDCSPGPCSQSGTRVKVSVTVRVPLPLVPQFIASGTTIATLESSSYEVIGAFE